MPEIAERLNKDIVVAMKAREEDKLTALRMVKSALKAKEIDKREPLTPAEEQSILTTMLKQRRESVEQFTKGNRPELAAKEQAEIALIEGYIPKAAGEDEVRKIVCEAIDQITKDNGGTRPGTEGHGRGDEGRAAAHSGQRHSRRRADGQRDGKGGAGEGRLALTGLSGIAKTDEELLGRRSVSVDGASAAVFDRP